MNLSVFDIYKVGIGPSSSHTVGPMKAARAFIAEIEARGALAGVAGVRVALYGSLALTGIGHGTDRAILLGLSGHAPETVEPHEIAATIEHAVRSGSVMLAGTQRIAFDWTSHIALYRDGLLPLHTNGMRFTALDEYGNTLHGAEFYSVGGGFIVRGGDATAAEASAAPAAESAPYPFDNAQELLSRCREHGLEIHELMLARECTWRSAGEVRERLMHLWSVMCECVQRGLHGQGLLPGVLKVRRRAPKLYRQLTAQQGPAALQVIDWVNAYALAVNEENAAGHRVVTAPTNGAAGIVPAVLHYYRRFEEGADDEGVIRFLLTAGAIAILFKRGASLSGAEMGCQGEVGVACSMAAAGLVSAWNGTNEQVENAAEIGMEHNLGLTCDPVAGLVQIPCIERNAMGAVKAINAARLALRGDGTHKVSLDQVIRTMRQTGRDMSTIYKETSAGGLAVNVPEC